MKPTYSRFDTITLAEEEQSRLDRSAEEARQGAGRQEKLPIIGRLPLRQRGTSAAAQQSDASNSESLAAHAGPHYRIDPPEVHTTAHYAPEESVSSNSAAVEHALVAPPRATTATLESTLADPPPQEDAAVDNDAALESSWLLRLDRAIMPYARWIALGALIAAVGLTLVLLSSRPSAMPNDATGYQLPRVATNPSSTELATAPVWNPAQGSIGVAPTEAAVTKPATHAPAATKSTLAQGPTGMPAPQTSMPSAPAVASNNAAIQKPIAEQPVAAGAIATSQAELAGHILPVQPYRSSAHSAVAQQSTPSQPYPRTANAATVSSQGKTQR